MDTYREIIVNRQALLRDDFQTLDVIDEQLEAYQVDMRRDFRYQRDRVDNVLYAMMERGDAFFDDTLRITRILELVNAERMRGEFERVVVADTSREIEQYVGELIDWMVDKDYRQWQAVMEYLNRRVAEHSDRMVGKVGSEFEFNRQKLLASVGRSAREVVDGYDRSAEALKLGREVQRAIIQTAAVEVGALGLGAVLVAVLQTTMLDITGVLGASAVAASGAIRPALSPSEDQGRSAQPYQRPEGAPGRGHDPPIQQRTPRQRPAHQRGHRPLHPLCARRAGEAGSAGRGTGPAAQRIGGIERRCAWIEVRYFMGKIAADLTVQELNAYRTATRLREQAQSEQISEQIDVRFEKAWTVARQAVSLLKEKYGIEKVWIFGSLLTRRRFHRQSDIDLAVWTLDDDSWLGAIGDLQELDSDFRIEVVELIRATASIRQVVAEEGKLL